MVDRTTPPDEPELTTGGLSVPEPPRRNRSLLDALATRHRRHVVRHLAATGDGVVSLDDLVEQAGVRDQEDGASSDGDDHQRLRVRLHHVALPKLADAGILEYDSRSGAVRYTGDEAAEAVLDLLETMGEH